jgi:hypothetical protein
MTPLQRRSEAAKKAAETRKRMKAARGIRPKCSYCGGDRTNPHDCYCRTCRTQYTRDWRAGKIPREKRAA